MRTVQGIQVKTIRCDNAGENLKFEETCKHQGLKVKFEYTAPGTPQQNGKVERKFANLAGMIRAMMQAAEIEQPFRGLLWAEAANSATDLLHSITLKPDEQEVPSKAFYGMDAPFARRLRTFGEVGVVRDIRTVKSKSTSHWMQIGIQKEEGSKIQSQTLCTRILPDSRRRFH